MKSFLTKWLRWQFKLIYRLGFCVDVYDGFDTRLYAMEAQNVEVVGVFD